MAGPGSVPYGPLVAVDLATLPLIDEHRVLVKASPDAVWGQLGQAIGHPPHRLAGPLATLLGANPARAAGDPLSEGATLPGFAVTEAVPGSRLVLAGHHRFATYALTFTLTEREGTTLVRARTYARFPGLRGRAYRSLVIGSGTHRILLTRLLRGLRLSTQALSRSARR